MCGKWNMELVPFSKQISEPNYYRLRTMNYKDLGFEPSKILCLFVTTNNRLK